MKGVFIFNSSDAEYNIKQAYCFKKNAPVEMHVVLGPFPNVYLAIPEEAEKLQAIGYDLAE